MPTARSPVGNYVPAVLAGDLPFLSGAGPALPDGGRVRDKVGEGGLDVVAARAAARLVGRNC